VNNLVDTLDLSLICTQHHDVLLLITHQCHRHNKGCFFTGLKFDKLVSVVLICVDFLNEAHFYLI